jgi:hypothetical protein
MKKSLLFIIVSNLLISTAMIGQTDNWIKTSEGKYAISKVKVHQGSTVIIMPDGQKKSVPTSSVDSYCVDDKTYNKMSLFDKGVSKEPVFMEHVKTIDNMSLYKYHDTNRYIDRYFVYKGNDYYIEIQPKAHPEFAVFFQN